MWSLETFVEKVIAELIAMQDEGKPSVCCQSFAVIVLQTDDLFNGIQHVLY